MERDFDVRTTTAKKIISEWTHQENVSVYKPSSVFPRDPSYIRRYKHS
jgi:hypothetical protein